jgi:hypothetical protein
MEILSKQKASVNYHQSKCGMEKKGNNACKHSPPWISDKFVSLSNARAYPSGTKFIPWCVSVDRDAIAVDSCPPPRLPVDMNRPAGLPCRPPVVQRLPVVSQKAFKRKKEESQMFVIRGEKWRTREGRGKANAPSIVRACSRTEWESQTGTRRR